MAATAERVLPAHRRVRTAVRAATAVRVDHVAMAAAAVRAAQAGHRTRLAERAATAAQEAPVQQAPRGWPATVAPAVRVVLASTDPQALSL
jgi:hypothetical protein